MTIVLNKHGKPIDFDAAVLMMDLALREELHSEGHDTDQEFLVAYAARHEEHFGEPFTPFAGGSW